MNSSGGEGAEVIYALRNSSTLARNVLENIEQAGQKVTKYYQRRLPENPIEDYYFIHRDTGNTQPIIVQYGYIDNSSDAARLQEHLLDYAEGVVKGVAEYIGINYVSPDGSIDEYYTVKSGDSLWSIAQKFNTTVSALKELNRLTSNNLSIGQKLKIPTTSITPPNEQEYITYTVKSGDTLYKIANQSNTSVQQLIDLNNLTSTNLSIGQTLLIPSKDNSSNNNSTTTYTVKSGDSLWSISQMFNITVQQIINANNLTTNNLSIGQVLTIPNFNMEDNGNNDSSTITYTVKTGDSLYSIAKRFNTTVDEIKRLNQLSSNLLSLGQKLIIPSATGDSYATYTVRLNDSLYKIASRYGTTVDELKKINNLTSNSLSIGQQLLVPIQ